MSSDELEQLVPRFRALAKDFRRDVCLEDEDFLLHYKVWELKGRIDWLTWPLTLLRFSEVQLARRRTLMFHR
jgi:hypothetical protein